jgi:phosphotransferase system  glucose/maltose/N-acetylglucosamine-specific IIC component
MDPRHLARIRLLSTRFLALQGFRVALLGASIAVVIGGYLIATPTPTREGALGALFVALLLMLPGQSWLHRYYATTFGRVQLQWKPRNPWLIPAMLLGQLALLAFTGYLNRRFPEIPAGAPTAVFVPVIAVLFAIRDWPWRAHYLGVAAVVVIAFAATFLNVGDSGTTLAATLFAVGVSLVPAGLLDHRLLVRLMQEARRHQAAVTAGPASEG